MNNTYKFAFTLAEVLITLAIIGVIAAMTIPSLMSKTNDAELKAAAKVAYSNLSQAVMKVSQDHAGVSLPLAMTTQMGYGPDPFMRELASKMSVSKTCYQGSGSICWNTEVAYGGLAKGIYDARGGNGAIDSSFVLNNGSFVGFLLDSGSDFAYGEDTGRSFVLVVDTNGLRPPNKYCKDIVPFYVDDKNMLKTLKNGELLDNYGVWTTSDGSTTKCGMNELF